MPFQTYKITNATNGRKYIGATSFSLERRWIEHVRAAKCNVKSPLYNAMREDGIENFTIAPIDEYLDEVTMYTSELDLILQLGTTYPQGYNVRKKLLTNEQALIVKFDVYGMTSKEYAAYLNVPVSVIRLAKRDVYESGYRHLTQDNLHTLIAFSSQF